MKRISKQDHADGPTSERIKHSDGNYDVGDDRRGTRVYTMKDSTLDRLHSRGAITKKQHDVLEKFRFHWFQAGMAGKISAPDIDRVFTSGGGYSDLNGGERASFHLGIYNDAKRHIGGKNYYSVEMIVCHDGRLEDAGKLLGWAHPMQARAAALEVLRDAADRLADLWRI